MNPGVTRSSMLNWWPLTSGLNIPQPKTIILPFEDCDREALNFEGTSNEMIARVQAALPEVGGPPAFLRTDQSSGKHSYLKGCYIPKDCPDMARHLCTVITSNLLCDLWPAAFAVRQFIPLAAKFTAFDGLPIAPERRYMVRDNVVERHFAYWPAEAIAQSADTWVPSEDNWRELLQQVNEEQPGEVKLLTAYSELVGSLMEGYWSVDFAQGADGQWYLIDMAEGDMSWQPDAGASA